MNTFGFLVGEIVRRVSGQPIGVFFQRNVAEPLGADFHFGLPAREHWRVAEFLFPQMPRLQPGAPPNMTAHAYMNRTASPATGPSTRRRGGRRRCPHPTVTPTPGPWLRSTARWREPTAASPLAPATLAAATSEASCGLDAVLGRPSRFGLGFQLTQPERPLGPSPNAYGHFGEGGSLGFADPDARLAFGYTPNHGLGPRWQNPRNRALLDALYSCL